ncbi:MAG: hypothetical protein K6F82_05365 [Sphaerochaetaceae bacterium]|nr:hypothetical protein [Sphaerochaetaceae bacterium]
MKKKVILISFIFFSALCLQALPLEARGAYSRNLSYIEYEESPSVCIGDSVSLFAGYRAETWSAGAEGSVCFLQEAKNFNTYQALGDLGGFSLLFDLCYRGEGVRASLGCGLSFYSPDFDRNNFFSMACVKSEIQMKVVEKKNFSLHAGLSLKAETGGLRKALSLGFVTSLIYGGSPGGIK